MIKRFLVTAFMFCTLQSFAQISLENTYSKVSGFGVFNFDSDGDKFVFYDADSRNIQLYNTNHTLWKSFSSQIPTGYNLAGLYCVSKKFFNGDNSIEAAVGFYSTSPTKYTLHIVKDDGSKLLTIDDGYYCFARKVNSDWKFIAYKSSYTEALVYSVPGVYTSMAPEPSSPITEPSSIFPNPFSAAATLKYSLPSGSREGTIEVYNLSGTLVRTYRVTDHFSDILITRGELPAGMYVYKVSAEGRPVASERFVIE